MTYPEDKPKREPFGERTAWFMVGIIVATAVAIGLLGIIITNGSQAEPIPYTKPVIVNSTYQDTNQTRAELLEIINNQRTAVYSSYALEYYFCQDKVGAENLEYAQRLNFRMQGSTMSELVECKRTDGGSVTYRYTYDYTTNEFADYILFSPGST